MLADHEAREAKKKEEAHKRYLKNARPLPLPKDVCVIIAKHVNADEAFAFAMTCKGFHVAMKEAALETKRQDDDAATGTLLKTTLRPHYIEWHSDDCVPVSEDWIKWAFSTKWEYAKEYNEKYNEKEKRSSLAYLAARGGFRDLVVWLKSQGCAFDWETAKGAAIGGHLKILKYLKGKRVSFDSRTSRGAALGGHIKVLKYLKREGVTLGR
jgi:hypothetical protein